MAAAVVTSRIVSEDAQHVRYLFTGTFTDTQESAVTKVDVSGLVGAVGTTAKVSIRRVKFNVSGGSISVLIGSAAVLQLSGNGEYSGDSLTVTGSANDDVKFTTTGIPSGGVYTVDLTVRKDAGFLFVPILLSAEVATGDYVTGQEIPVVATFDKAVHVGGASVFEIDINGETVHASVEAGKSGTAITFRYLVKPEDHGEVTEVTLGDLIRKAGEMALYGGSPAAAASIPASGSFTADITDVSVNAAAGLDSVALVGGTSYETGDRILVKVTMSKPVTVTGTPLLPLTLASGAVNAAFVTYGDDQSELLFAYDVTAEDQAEATEFDIADDIDLDGGSMVNADAPGVAAVLTIVASDTSAVEVNPA